MLCDRRLRVLLHAVPRKRLHGETRSLARIATRILTEDADSLTAAIKTKFCQTTRCVVHKVQRQLVDALGHSHIAVPDKAVPFKKSLHIGNRRYLLA